MNEKIKQLVAAKMKIVDKKIEQELSKIQNEKANLGELNNDYEWAAWANTKETYRARKRADATLFWTKFYEGALRPVVKDNNTPAFREKALTRYARERIKTGNQRFDLNFFDEKRYKKLVDFTKGTNIRTIKRLLKNNVNEAVAQGATNWTTRAKKMIDNFKGDKQDLIRVFGEKYANKLAYFSSDLLAKNKNSVSIIKTTERLTKRGTIRKRYGKFKNPNESAINKLNRHRDWNLQKAIWRILKIDNAIRTFNREGYGTVSHYLMNSIAHFAAIPGIGLSSLREEIFEHEEYIGVRGGEGKYFVKLGPAGMHVLQQYFYGKDNDIKIGARYERAFVDLRKEPKE